MSKHRLVFDDDYEFLCFGLSCHLKDYKLAWTLNNHFRLELARKTLVVNTKQQANLDFAYFKYADKKNHLRYYLINNLSEGIPMVKEYKQFNFLFLVEGFVELFNQEELLERIQRLDAIQLITPLPKEPLHKIQFELFEE